MMKERVPVGRKRVKVCITGASSGIGAATAMELASRSTDLLLVARRLERLKSLKTQLEASCPGVRVTVAVVDVSSERSVAKFRKEHHEFLASLNVLVNNAGFALGLESFQNSKMADFESMIEVNLTGLLRMLHLSLPGLLGRAKRGEVSHVIQIGSVAGRWAYPKGHVYCATKAAVSSLTQSLRLDLSGTGVRVTEIVPGKVETEFSLVRFQGDQKQAQAAYEGYRPLRSEDIARSIKFCLEQPLHVNIQEMVIYPTDQASPTVLSKSPDLLGNRKKKSRK